MQWRARGTSFTVAFMLCRVSVLLKASATHRMNESNGCNKKQRFKFSCEHYYINWPFNTGDCVYCTNQERTFPSPTNHVTYDMSCVLCCTNERKQKTNKNYHLIRQNVAICSTFARDLLLGFCVLPKQCRNEIHKYFTFQMQAQLGMNASFNNCYDKHFMIEMLCNKVIWFRNNFSCFSFFGCYNLWYLIWRMKYIQFYQICR